MSDEFLSAFHEAGHAVAMLVNSAEGGPSIEYIAITGLEAGLTGFVKRRPRWIAGVSDILPVCENDNLREQKVAFDRRQAELDIVEMLAGPAAECRQKLRCWELVEFEGLVLSGECFHGPLESGTDLEVVGTRMRWLHPADASKHFHGYWADAIDLVRVHWQRIDALARELLVRGRIEGEELDRWWHAT